MIGTASNPVARQLRIPAVTPPRAVQGGPEAGLAQEPPDAALISLIADGDQGAVGVLYQRHGAACYRLARQITANHSLAEDAVQDAYVALWRSPASYRGGRGSVRNFLLSLTHHKSVDIVRKETAEQRRQVADAAQQDVAPVTSNDPASIAWHEMRAAEVRAALVELPEVQRRTVALAYFGGYTQSQIAEITGVPLGTVKTRTFSAMRRLRLTLSPLKESSGGGLL